MMQMASPNSSRNSDDYARHSWCVKRLAAGSGCWSGLWPPPTCRSWSSIHAKCATSPKQPAAWLRLTDWMPRSSLALRRRSNQSRELCQVQMPKPWTNWSAAASSSSIAFGGAHVDELLAAADQFVQGLGICTWQSSRLWLDRLRKASDDLGIQSVSLSQAAGCFGEVAHLAWIDDWSSPVFVDR